ncbi:hypothetical protein ACWD6P_17850 [Streptomyces sp. NPDC002446]
MGIEPARKQEVEGLTASFMACSVDRLVHHLSSLFRKEGLLRHGLVRAFRSEKAAASFRKRRAHDCTLSQRLVVRPQPLAQPNSLDLPVGVEPSLDVGEGELRAGVRSADRCRERVVAAPPVAYCRSTNTRDACDSRQGDGRIDGV